MKTELLGLFVEDINLLRLAGLPFAHEEGFPSPISRELDIVAKEGALKVVAAQARQGITIAAEQHAYGGRFAFHAARSSPSYCRQPWRPISSCSAR